MSSRSTCSDVLIVRHASRTMRSLVSLLLLMLIGLGNVLGDDDTDQPTSPNAQKPLNFAFIREPPGQLISVGAHRLHVLCLGKGPVSILLDSGLGGTSLEWLRVQRALAERAKVCAYDRGGYAWSDPAREPRDARRLAREAHLLLNNLGIRGPLIVAGHSFGGFVVRRLANLRQKYIVGMVLVDASHEQQISRYEAISDKALLPRRGTFVIGAMAVPEQLPADVKRKIMAFGRMRKTYAAVYGEMKYFRDSADQVSALPRPVDYPVIVLRRGREPEKGDNETRQKETIWQELQSDLAAISDEGEVVVAKQSGHHIHVDQPDLLIETIGKLLDRYEENNI